MKRKEGEFLWMDGDGSLHLTDKGKKVAERIYERHQFFTSSLIELGVDATQAEEDACRIEHVISEESYQKLKEAKGRRIHGSDPDD